MDILLMVLSLLMSVSLWLSACTVSAVFYCVFASVIVKLQ